jgi:FAD/FMN-containing dehydrogenase
VQQWQSFLEEVKLAVKNSGFNIQDQIDCKDIENDFYQRPTLVFALFGHMGDENLHLNILLRYVHETSYL